MGENGLQAKILCLSKSTQSGKSVYFILIGLSRSRKLDLGGQFKLIFVMKAKENLKYQECLFNGKSTFHLQFHLFLTKFSIPFLSCPDLIFSVNSFKRLR